MIVITNAQDGMINTYFNHENQVGDWTNIISKVPNDKFLISV